MRHVVHGLTGDAIAFLGEQAKYCPHCGQALSGGVSGGAEQPGFSLNLWRYELGGAGDSASEFLQAERVYGEDVHYYKGLRIEPGGVTIAWPEWALVPDGK